MSVRTVRPHRGLYWVGVLLATVAVVVGAVLAWNSYQATTGPDGAVQGYFRALQHSDAATALGYGNLPAGPHTLLTGAVLREQQRLAPIRNVEILSVVSAGSTATVQVRYQLGFAAGVQTETDTIKLVHRGAGWRLVSDAVATTIHLQQAMARATIIGAGIPQGPMLMFPGAVPISFDSPYLELNPASSVIDFGAAAVTDVNVQVTAAGRAALGKQLDAAMQTCLSAHEPAASTCPLPSDRYVPGTLVGRLTGTPTQAMTVSVAADESGVLQVGGQITFTGTYQVLDFNNIAQSEQGSIQLPLAATAFAVRPLVLRWSTG